MKYRIEMTTKFKKDYKHVLRRGYNKKLLQDVIGLIAQGKKLPRKYKDHELKGEYSGCRECHITPDWLLVYKIEDEILALVLTRTGTHSDLF